MTEQTKAEAGAKLAEAVRDYADTASDVGFAGLLQALADYDAATKPRTITVNGVEVPEPVRGLLPLGMESPLWLTDPAGVDAMVMRVTWTNHPSQREWLKRGLLHRTKDAAESHARALIGASEVQS